MFDKMIKRPKEAGQQLLNKAQSINFADSLADHKPAPGVAAPTYNLANANADQGQQQSYNTGGSITFYCNGFLPERDYLGNEGRENKQDSDPDKNGETMHETYADVQPGAGDYWGNMDELLEQQFTGKAPNADSTFYFDGSAGPLSSADDRMEYGENAALRVIQAVESGQFQVNEEGVVPDAINIVGHSMGGAYAAGLAKGLLEYNKQKGKRVFDVRAVYYFAPHQPLDIEHPSEVRGVQYSHENDTVSSNGGTNDPLALWGLIPKGSGSTLAPIGGIHEFRVEDDKSLNTSLLGDRGGHNMSLHEYTLTEYVKDEAGYIAPNNDEDYNHENYSHQTVSQDGYEHRKLDIPNLIDKLENLPSDIRKKITELETFLHTSVGDASTLFKEKVGQGREWVDEKRQQGRDWADEKIDQGDEWIDGKVDEGDRAIDREIDKGTDWLKEQSGGLLNGSIDKLSDWVRGKKRKGVDYVKGKEDEGVAYAKSKVAQADEWLEGKTDKLEAWVYDKTDDLTSWVDGEVSKIAEWARSQITKGEQYVQRTMKAVQRKLRVLVKKIKAKIESIVKRINRSIAIIKENKQWIQD